MDNDCIFCKIVAGQIPCRKAYEDEDLLAFHDITPQAPLHVLIVPKAHIPTLSDLAPEHDAMIGKMHRVAAQLVGEAGQGDFRALFNCGEEAGQSVFHLHLHALAGRHFRWPPG